jgi:two-component system, chemotaxis family, response regulator PixG
MIPSQLTEELQKLGRDESDGELLLNSRKDIWCLHIFHGKLLYATNEYHRARRWDRALRQHCPKWKWGVDFAQLMDHQHWEYQLLDLGINHKRLSLIQAKLVVRSIIQECLFELSNQADFKDTWKACSREVSPLCHLIALSSPETYTIFNKVAKMQEKWHAAGLGYLSPTLAPTLKQESDLQATVSSSKQDLDPQALPISDKYLNANFTLWDIAFLVDKSVIEVTLSLISLVERGVLQFQRVPDLPISAFVQPPIGASIQQAATAQSSSEQLARFNQKQPLIACIDDSPVLTHTLRKILASAGYQVLSIPEPMRGFSQLIEHKPDLILLDLLLPNADGYSICKFLRDTPAFKETPIVILTAKNGSVDRTRAQLAGATEFLTKPPHAEELLQIVRKYL